MCTAHQWVGDLEVNGIGRRAIRCVVGCEDGFPQRDVPVGAAVGEQGGDGRGVAVGQVRGGIHDQLSGIHQCDGIRILGARRIVEVDQTAIQKHAGRCRRGAGDGLGAGDFEQYHILAQGRQVVVTDGRFVVPQGDQDRTVGKGHAAHNGGGFHQLQAADDAGVDVDVTAVN